MSLPARSFTLAVVFALLGLSVRASQVPDAPKLLVVLVIDQMRSDYIDRFGHHWTGGLQRLLQAGAWFSEAAYPFLGTVTCPGHATIGTGSFPSRHGLIQNRWWDRTAKRRVTCTDDTTVRAIGYDRPAQRRHSARALAVSTLAEELHRQSNGRSRAASLSVKPRSAVALVGNQADIVVWLDEASNAWATSSAYTPNPVPAVHAFIEAHPLSGELDRSWDRLRPATEYVYADDGFGERPAGGRISTFPHALRPGHDHPAETAYALWEQSPYSDDYLARMAVALVTDLGLGRGRATDFLGISFSALDAAGHDFGPESQEIEDLLLWLDRTMDRFFDSLDELVGADHYTVAVSADHGVAPIPERRQHEGLDGGRVSFRDLARRLEAALALQLGDGPHLEAIVHTNIYLTDGTYQRLVSRPKAMAAVVEAARATPGVEHVFTRDELQAGTASDNLALRAASLSYFPERGGDLAFVPKPYWITSNEAATHGTAHAYDARVPLILMGRGVRPGVYKNQASPADIAPTLAHLSGVDLGARHGRILSEAVTSAGVSR